MACLFVCVCAGTTPGIVQTRHANPLDAVRRRPRPAHSQSPLLALKSTDPPLWLALSLSFFVFFPALALALFCVF
jgi:hypothetical protein